MEVQCYIQICGDYAAWHEISFSVLYDITNDIQLGDFTLEELGEMVGETDYCDVDVETLYKINDRYFMEIA